MDFNLNSKEIPAITPNFPPMPKPEDFGIDWNDAGLVKAMERGAITFGFVAAERNLSVGEAMFRCGKHQAQVDAYIRSLEAWKEQVSKIAEAIRTNK